MGDGLKRANASAKATRTKTNPLAEGLNLRSSKDRATLKAREAQAELNRILDEYLRRRGAVREERYPNGPSGHVQWLISTPLGELRVHGMDAVSAFRLLSIFGRFEDPKRACAKLNCMALGGGVNPFSGKWNFHMDFTVEYAFNCFRTNLEAFAPIDVTATQNAPGFFTIAGETVEGKDWILANVDGASDDGDTCCDDTRMANDIVAGMRKAGLTVMVIG